MAIKRKRTMDHAVGLCATHMDTDTNLDTSAAPASNPWTFANASRIKSSDWGHRTRKRYRDNRPDEQAIHETTLNKLFAAQRGHSHASSTPTTGSLAPPARPLVLDQQKSTLHTFWKQLPAAPVQSLLVAAPSYTPSPMLQRPQCEDCDAVLHDVDGREDMDMDVAMGDAEDTSPFACYVCRKRVCGTCAVVAARRICLGCATSGGGESPW